MWEVQCMEQGVRLERDGQASERTVLMVVPNMDTNMEEVMGIWGLGHGVGYWVHVMESEGWTMILGHRPTSSVYETLILQPHD